MKNKMLLAGLALAVLLVLFTACSSCGGEKPEEKGDVPSGLAGQWEIVELEMNGRRRPVEMYEELGTPVDMRVEFLDNEKVKVESNIGGVPSGEFAYTFADGTLKLTDENGTHEGKLAGSLLSITYEGKTVYLKLVQTA